MKILKEFFSLQYNNKITVLLFFLFIFQMLGIRLFKGWGIIITFIIFLILFFNIKLTFNRLVKSFGLAVSAFIFQWFKGSPINYCIVISLYIINACFMVYYTAKQDLRNDFKAALKIFLIQAFLSVVVYIIIPKSLMWVPATEGVHNLTFLYLFYYIPDTIFGSLPRLSGLAWEPGCMQLLINLYLVFLVIENANVRELIIPSILIVLTGSSAGYVIYILILFIYFFKRNLRKIILYIPIIIILCFSLLPILWANISNKLSIGTDTINTSGAIRMRDFFTGVEALKNYPLLGVDMSDLENSKQYQELEDAGLSHISIIGDNWHQYFDYAAGGYTNGLFTITMMWGIWGIYFLYHFIKSKLWKAMFGHSWLIVPLIFGLSFISEPITNTIFFYFIAFYNFCNKPQKSNSLQLQ